MSEVLIKFQTLIRFYDPSRFQPNRALTAKKQEVQKGKRPNFLSL